MDNPFEPIRVFLGVKFVRCVTHASRLRIDPDIPVVQSIKQGMLDLDHVD